MASTASRVRCYSCGRRQPADSAACERCGSQFQALCDCGEQLSVYSASCPGCGAERLPPKFPWRRTPLARSLLVVALLGVAGLAAAAVLTPEPTPAWRLKNDALAAFASKDHRRAAELFEEALEQTRLDAEIWFNLAACYYALGNDAETFVLPNLEAALEIRPEMLEALLLRAVVEADRGRVDRAVADAQAATQVLGGSAKAWRLRGELELRRPAPDLATALAALERARDLGDATPQLQIKIAQIQLVLYRGTSPARFPPSLRASLRVAQEALERTDDRLLGTTEKAIARALLTLGTEQPDEAFRIADMAISALPASPDPAIHAQLLVLRGLALHTRGAVGNATQDFRRALSVHPRLETASLIQSNLVPVGGRELAESVLAEAAEKLDPKGGIHAVLAGLLLAHPDADEQRRHDLLEGALRLVEESGRRGGRNADLSVLRGQIHLALRDFDAARAAFDEAQSAAPTRSIARVRRVAIALHPDFPEAQREESLRAGARELASLLETHPSDSDVLATLGRVELVLGDSASARTHLQAAVRSAPADAGCWLDLAAAWTASGEIEGLYQAARAFGQARSLRPDDVSIYVRQANAWLAAGEPSEAIRTCNQLLGDGEPDLDLLEVRAQALRRIERWDRAAADLRVLVDRRHRLQFTLPDLVDALCRTGAKEQALALIEEHTASIDEATRDMVGMILTLRTQGTDALLERVRAERASPLEVELALMAGFTDQALDAARRYLAEHPGDPRVSLLGVTALVNGAAPDDERIREAREILDAVADDAPAGLRELMTGAILLAEGDLHGAVEPLRTAVGALPSASFPQYLLGIALCRTGDLQGGLAALRRAVAAPVSLPAIKLRSARWILEGSQRSTDLAAAEQLAREALRLSPTLTPAVERLAGLLHARGEYRAAAELAEERLTDPRLDPRDRVSLRYVAACARLSGGSGERALHHLERLGAGTEDDPLVIAMRGFALLSGAGSDVPARVDLDRAWTEFQTALSKDPAHFAAGLGIVEVLALRGEAQAALDFVHERRRVHPESPELELAAASRLLRRSERKLALTLTREYAERHPDDLYAATRLAHLLAATGDPAEAVAVVADRARRAPASSRFRALLALAAAQCNLAGMPQDALTTLEEVTASAGATQEVVLSAEVGRAEALVLLGQIREAAERIDAVTSGWDEGAPRTASERQLEPRIRFAAGSLALARGQYEQAALQFARSVELVPDDHSGLNNLAWALAHTQGGAERAFEVACRVTQELAPEVASYWDTRAYAACQLRRETEALQAWEKALELYAASPRPAPRERAATALRYADYLQELGRILESRRVLSEIPGYAPDSPESVQARNRLDRK